MEKIKLCINSKDAVMELLKDKEFEVEVRKTILNQLAKQYVKAGFDDMRKGFEEEILNMLDKAKKEHIIYERDFVFREINNSAKLQENIRKAVKEHYDELLLKEIINMEKKASDYLKERIEEVVNHWKSTILTADSIEGMIKEELMKAIHVGLK